MANWTPQGFIGLAYYDSGARSLYTAKKPVRSLADAKGMKIRVQQSDMWVAMMQAIGANARAAAFHDPRFPPLEHAELEGLEVEVSVLSPRLAVMWAAASGISCGNLRWDGPSVRPTIESSLPEIRAITSQIWCGSGEG